MAKKAVRKKKKRVLKKTRSRYWHGIRKSTIVWALVIVGFVSFTYIGYLDYTVRNLFEGKRWSIPARVYARPVELYAGVDVDRARFQQLMKHLRYRQDSRLATEGTYYASGGLFRLRTRNFFFWDGEQPGRRVQVSFSSRGVSSLKDLQTGRDLPILRLDPVQIGSFHPGHNEDRILVRLDQVPDSLVDALLATEDRDFYSHFGVSLRGIARAMWANIRAGAVVQGGSTITQQLVKNFYLDSERSLRRKLNEAIMSVILESRYSKDEILEAYLNEIYLGQEGARAIHGFGLASQFYFDRSVKDLELHHTALLVALLRGASFYDPRRFPDRARERRDQVLEKMRSMGAISDARARAAAAKPLDVRKRGRMATTRYPAFMDLVRRQLREQYRDEDLTSEGLRILTTLDLHVQQRLESVASSQLARMEKRRGVNRLQVASVVTRREGGEIVALLGGRNARFAGLNRAVDIKRMIGSLVKPAVYLTALNHPGRYTITSRVNDTAIRMKAGGKVWSPRNFDRKEHGAIPMHQALAKSYNLATVRIGMDLGVAHVVKTLRNMGMQKEVNAYPSVLLGAVELSPVEVTRIYQTLSADGFSTPLRAIQAVTASDGSALQRYPLSMRQTLDPGAVFIVNTILQEVMQGGTGRSAYSVLPAGHKAAGKTGTTNNLRDSWFAGFTGDFLAVVWVGRDDNKSTGLTGSSGALQIWSRLMAGVSSQPLDLIAPDTVEWAMIDPESGLRAGKSCAGAREYPFIRGSAPLDSAPCVINRSSGEKPWYRDWF